MSQVSHGSAVGRPSFFKGDRGNEERGDEAGGHEKNAHDDRGGREQPAGVADAELKIVVALDQRHHGNAGFEAGKPEGETGKEHA